MTKNLYSNEELKFWIFFNILEYKPYVSVNVF